MDTIMNSQGQLGLAHNTKKNYRHLKVIYNEYEKTRTKKGLNHITLKQATKEDLEHLREYLSWKNSLFKQNNLNKSAGGSSFIKADNGKKLA